METGTPNISYYHSSSIQMA